MSRYATFVLVALATFSAYALGGPGEVSVEIQYAAALHGRAVPPHGLTQFDGVTVFCTVIVDNQTGKNLARVGPQPGRERTGSVFDSLFLTVCDDSGKSLSRHPYRWQAYSNFPGYWVLVTGRTTNELFYLVPSNAVTNNEIAVRLEGSLNTVHSVYSGSITSNVVKIRLK